MATGQTARAYTPLRSDICMQEVTKQNKSQSVIQCTNIFKNQDTISDSLTFIWTEIINILENTGSIVHNDVVQSHTHQNLKKDEVRN